MNGAESSMFNAHQRKEGAAATTCAPCKRGRDATHSSGRWPCKTHDIRVCLFSSGGRWRLIGAAAADVSPLDRNSADRSRALFVHFFQFISYSPTADAMKRKEKMSLSLWWPSLCATPAVISQTEAKNFFDISFFIRPLARNANVKWPFVPLNRYLAN